jgi:hypothetical protein
VKRLGENTQDIRRRSGAKIQMLDTLFRTCEVCGNKHGFKEGCCRDSGWNYKTERFDFIRVMVEDLPSAMRAPLIAKYAALFCR